MLVIIKAILVHKPEDPTSCVVLAGGSVQICSSSLEQIISSITSPAGSMAEQKVGTSAGLFTCFDLDSYAHDLQETPLRQMKYTEVRI